MGLRRIDMLARLAAVSAQAQRAVTYQPGVKRPEVAQPQVVVSPLSKRPVGAIHPNAGPGQGSDLEIDSLLSTAQVSFPFRLAP